MILISTKKHLPMIIKLTSPFAYARHKETKVAKPLSHKEKVNADRLFMIILLMITIVAAVVIV